jgi:hypothetical protein
MKRSVQSFIAVFTVFSGAFIATYFTHTPSVHAQTGCDLTSFSGAYGYNLTGYVYDNQGNLYFLASAGRIVADGNGGLTGADTYSFDGTIGKRTYTGSYSMNADCTGSTALQITAGTSTGTAHGDIVAVNNAREINFVQTDNNYVFSGSFKKQVQ